MEFQSQVKQSRERAQFSQTELAKRVGIGRQSLCRIEAGVWLPNTAIALKLAHELRTTVEELFPAVSAAPTAEERSHSAPAKRVQLARIRNQICAFPADQESGLEATFHLADGVCLPDGRLADPAPEIADNTIVLQGCDPAFGLLAGLMQQEYPDQRLLTRFAPSMIALSELVGGRSHIAGIHLEGEAAGKRISSAVMQQSQTPMRCIVFAQFEQGLMVAKGNPLGISSVADLADSEIRLINRQVGAGCRIMLDEALQKAEIDHRQVNGYETEASSHWGSAMAILHGLADVGLGLRAVAEARGLDFISMEVKRCDLVIPKDFLELKGIAAILELLNGGRLKRELQRLSGYDSSRTGEILVGIA